ncbi:MAG TPA: hypothetical protein VIL58_02515 [Thermoplasmata archaeon]
MAKGRAERDARRRRGILIGGLGLGLTFAPAIALLFVPPGYTLVTLGLMLVGIALLVVGFFTTPRRAPPKA